MAAQRTYLAIDLKSFYASVECVDPVSYTHLDVYKRQPQLCIPDGADKGFAEESFL